MVKPKCRFVEDKYKEQNKVLEENANYGVRKYSYDQKELYIDIMKLMKSKKYKKIGIDACLIVFGRVYSVYILAQLKKEGKIEVTKYGECKI